MSKKKRKWIAKGFEKYYNNNVKFFCGRDMIMNTNNSVKVPGRLERIADISFTLIGIGAGSIVLFYAVVPFLLLLSGSNGIVD